jgi:amidase
MLETLTDWLAASPAEREDALQASLARIHDLDRSIHAWAHVEAQPPTGSGPLAGIPFAAKDIFETRGLPTEYGSPVYRGRIGTEDAAIVRDLRDRGAVLLGKTHTAAFAHRTPPPTRNPRHLEHTPGGSSSGSAAAVAAGMVPLALGTQTKGSVLRPASYCGVTGFKPTYGLLPMDGILPLSPSLDTVGFFTQTPADMHALWEVLGHAAGPRRRTGPATFAVPDPLPVVEPAMADAFYGAIAAMRDAGVSIRRIDVADMLATLCEANDAVMHYEGARVHRERYAQFGRRLGEIARLVRRGLLVSARRYAAAKTLIAGCRERMAQVFADTSIILVPAATGAAPAGLSSTGDASMNASWTALGTPAISIPLPSSGLPLGLQLIAAHGDDAALLAEAVRVHAIIGRAVPVALT